MQVDDKQYTTAINLKEFQFSLISGTFKLPDNFFFDDIEKSKVPLLINLMPYWPFQTPPLKIRESSTINLILKISLKSLCPKFFTK
jgi:hypothetical protein